MASSSGSAAVSEMGAHRTTPWQAYGGKALPALTTPGQLNTPTPAVAEALATQADPFQMLLQLHAAASPPPAIIRGLAKAGRCAACLQASALCSPTSARRIVATCARSMGSSWQTDANRSPVSLTLMGPMHLHTPGTANTTSHTTHQELGRVQYSAAGVESKSLVQFTAAAGRTSQPAP